MTVIRSRLIFVSIFTILAAGAAAQEKISGLVSGIVVDESSNIAVQFVNVALRSSGDSAVVAGQLTDSIGKFAIGGVPEGEYYLTGQMIGYKPKKTRSFHVDSDHQSIDLGKIKIAVTNILMDEVQVSAEKPLYTTSIDRKVYNVERDLVSKAGSASELLRNVPSVEVDIDGNVSLRGSSNVLIMLNGRPSPMMNKNSATVLEQMPANSIERVEVITNPTAEFKPDAAAGIINIVLKKNSAGGIAGSVSGNAGNSNRYNSNFNLNYNPGLYNVYVNYGIRRNNRDRHSSDNRLQSDTTYAGYNQKTDSHARPLSHTASFGGEYHPNKVDQCGISGSYFYNSFVRSETSGNTYYDVNHVLASSYQRNRTQDQYNKDTEVTAFYEHDFAKEDEKLRFEATAAFSPEVEDNRFTNDFTMPVAPSSYDKSLLKSSENSGEFTAEYSLPLSEGAALKTGYSAELLNSDFDFRVDSFQTAQHQYIVNTAKTNRFRRDELINAAYGTYKRAFGKFGAMVGLRGEYASVKSDLVTLDSTIAQSYFNVYPSLHLSLGIAKPTELQLSYSKRIRRPESDDLNPFPEYTDPRNVRAGNPKLRPEYIHSLELGCQYRQGSTTVVPALFYRYTYNRFTWMTRALSDSVMLTTEENLSNNQDGGFEVNVTANAGKLATLHGTASIFRSQIDASNLNGGKKTVSTWSSNLTLDLNLSETTRMQLSSNYRSSRLTAQGTVRPSYTLNGGLRQELFGGRVLFLATVTDIFHTMRRDYTLDTATLHETTTSRMDSRVVYAGLTFKFGTQPKKSHDEQIHYDEAQ